MRRTPYIGGKSIEVPEAAVFGDVVNPSNQRPFFKVLMAAPDHVRHFVGGIPGKYIRAIAQHIPIGIIGDAGAVPVESGEEFEDVDVRAFLDLLLGKRAPKVWFGELVMTTN